MTVLNSQIGLLPFLIADTNVQLKIHVTNRAISFQIVNLEV